MKKYYYVVYFKGNAIGSVYTIQKGKFNPKIVSKEIAKEYGYEDILILNWIEIDKDVYEYMEK